MASVYHDPGGALLLLALACDAPPAPLAPRVACPTPTVEVGEGWRVVHERSDTLAIQREGTADGVRLALGPSAPGDPPGAPVRLPGLSPVADGRTFDVVEDGVRWPLVAPGYPVLGLTRCLVRARGPDLVWQMDGASLREVSAHPNTPDDPILSWVRVRPRGHDWRIVIDGLATLSLPGGVQVVPSEHDGFFRVSDPSWGEAEIATGARVYRSERTPGRWWLFTGPAVAQLDPYPRTTLTWAPPASAARPETPPGTDAP